MSTGKIFIASFLCCITWLSVSAQKERGMVREGNQRYIEGKYDEAEKEYNKALDVNNNLPEGVFNLGDVAYQKQDYQKAASQFETAAMLMKDTLQKAKAYHNLGNAYLKLNQYEKSIEAYKNALRLNPGDMDTKYNLAYAQRMLKENPQNQQKQQQQNDDKKDQEKKDQQQQQDKKSEEQQSKEQQQKQEQQKQQEQQAKEQQSEQKEGEQKDQQQQGQPKQVQLSKEQAQRLLEALMQEEKKVQQQIINKKLPPEKRTTEKDW